MLVYHGINDRQRPLLGQPRGVRPADGDARPVGLPDDHDRPVPALPRRRHGRPAAAPDPDHLRRRPAGLLSRRRPDPRAARHVGGDVRHHGPGAGGQPVLPDVEGAAPHARPPAAGTSSRTPPTGTAEIVTDPYGDDGAVLREPPLHPQRGLRDVPGVHAARRDATSTTSRTTSAGRTSRRRRSPCRSATTARTRRTRGSRASSTSCWRRSSASSSCSRRATTRATRGRPGAALRYEVHTDTTTDALRSWLVRHNPGERRRHEGRRARPHAARGRAARRGPPAAAAKAGSRRRCSALTPRALVFERPTRRYLGRAAVEARGARLAPREDALPRVPRRGVVVGQTPRRTMRIRVRVGRTYTLTVAAVDRAGRATRCRARIVVRDRYRLPSAPRMVTVGATDGASTTISLGAVAGRATARSPPTACGATARCTGRRRARRSRPALVQPLGDASPSTAVDRRGVDVGAVRDRADHDRAHAAADAGERPRQRGHRHRGGAAVDAVGPGARAPGRLPDHPRRRRRCSRCAATSAARDEPLVRAATYTFRVQAVDTLGGASAPSAPLTVRTADPDPTRGPAPRVPAGEHRPELPRLPGALPPDRDGPPDVLRLHDRGGPDRQRRPADHALGAGAARRGAAALQLPAHGRAEPDPQRSGAARGRGSTGSSQRVTDSGADGASLDFEAGLHTDRAALHVVRRRPRRPPARAGPAADDRRLGEDRRRPAASALDVLRLQGAVGVGRPDLRHGVGHQVGDVGAGRAGRHPLGDERRRLREDDARPVEVRHGHPAVRDGLAGRRRPGAPRRPATSTRTPSAMAQRAGRRPRAWTRRPTG